MNAETFNALYEVGTPVLAYPGCRREDFPNDRRLVTRTRSRASVLGGHTDVAWVDDHSSCIALSHIDVVTEDEWEAAKTAEAVRAEGALPVPAGPVRLTAEREAEIRERVPNRTAEFTAWLNTHSPLPGGDAADHAEAVLEEDVPALLAELDAVRAERDQARRQLDARTEDIAFLERNTLPELRREIEHHKAGKDRWRKRAEKAEPERDTLQRRLNQAAMTRTWRNEDGKKFVFVEDIAPALLGIEPKPEATS